MKGCTKPQDTIHQGKGGGEIRQTRSQEMDLLQPEAEWIFGAKPEALLKNATINSHIFALIK
jgi:hypothetical protein